MNIKQIRQITKALSQERRAINQSIERIHREIEFCANKIESPGLGEELVAARNRIEALNDLGMSFSHQLQELTQQLSYFRAREDELKIEEDKRSREQAG